MTSPRPIKTVSYFSTLLITPLLSPLLALPLLTPFVPFAPALADVTPATDGTNTVINRAGEQFQIRGGQISGTNQFHSFEEFDLTNQQSASFRTPQDIKNVLGRITGGSASFINGTIELLGSDANLFLMNPAGMFFGQDATLNVPSSFTATTATGIGFGDAWFNAEDPNNYAALVGDPSIFSFTTTNPGALVNSGNLVVGEGRSLTLLGGTVINTGTLTAPGGDITIAAIEGGNLARISQENSLLSLEVETVAERSDNGGTFPNTLSFTPLDIPQLLTGGPTHATDLAVNPDGSIRLTTTNTTIPTDPGTGTLTLSGATINTNGGNFSGQGAEILVNGGSVIDARNPNFEGTGSISLTGTGGNNIGTAILRPN